MSIAARLRAGIYDAAIVGMTGAWYRAVLERVPEHAHLLDVGIGTGAALRANAELIVQRDLRITGVDIDAAYIERCRAEVEGHQLESRIEVRLESVYDHAGGPYEAAYFSGSFMLLPDPAGALRHVAKLLAPRAPVYFTQTFEHARSPLLERVKPLLRWVTTIDFGRVTYEAEFRNAVAAGGLPIESVDVIENGARRSSVLVTARI